MDTPVYKLTTKEELDQYAQVASYCFFDRTGWTGRLLHPDRFRGNAYGCKDEGKVKSGIISFDLSFTYWGESGIPSSGIGCVASDPAVRNEGHIRQILNRVLRDNYDEGKVLSFLYPFSYRYYGMFGYGTMGHAARYKFNPEELTTRKSPPGGYSLFDRSTEQYGEYLDLKNRWARQFHGGVEETVEEAPLDQFLEEMDRDRQFLYFYRDEKDAAQGCLLYKMKEHTHQQGIEVIRAAWSDNRAFRALAHYLWRHRSQVGEICWTLPLSVPLEMLTGEPRIFREDVQMWMGRPVNVPEALKMKSAYSPVEKAFSFSLEDPALPENSGTYHLKGKDVQFRQGEQSAPPIDFSPFSAMVMGGLSPAEARTAGLIPEDFRGDPSYLSRLENLCITEGF